MYGENRVMLSVYSNIDCACLSDRFLSALAPLRTLSGVTVLLRDGKIWVRWQSHQQDVLKSFLPVPGIEFFAFAEGHWRPPGAALPAFDVPSEATFQPLHQVLFPSPINALKADGQWIGASIHSIPLRLVPDDEPRPTT